MAIPTIPFKTPLGNDELRLRTHKLGQRHRTILFLIDGRRPLAEVLSLGQQAGAATQYFEDLLRLGMVELPPDPTPPPPSPPELPVLGEEAELTTVELIVAPDPEEQVTIRAPLTVEAPARREPEPEPMLHETAPALPEPAPASPPRELPPLVPVLDEAVSVAPSVVPASRQQPREAPDIALPLPDQGEAQMLQKVRDLLTDTLRIDAPLFSARTFVRVRNAQSVGELIDLVWEIQDHLSHKRRSQRELQSLQHARELLGLGNTLVSDDDTRPPYLDE
jgi:hypothetical protein